MAETYKVEQLFKQGDLTWSESWYVIAETHTEAFEKFTSAGQLCMAFRASNVYWRATRIKRVRVPQNQNDPLSTAYKSHPNRFRGAVQVLAQAVNAEAEATRVCWTGYLRAVNAGAKRNIFFRGLPDEYVNRDDDRNITPTAALQTAVKNYLDALVTAQIKLQINALNRDRVAFPYFQVQAFDVAANGLVGFTALPGENPQFSPRDILYFNGLSLAENPWARGSHLLANIEIEPATGRITFRLFTRTGRDVSRAIRPGQVVWVRKLAYQDKEVTEWQYVRMSERRTGSSLFRQRGKAEPVGES